MRTIIQSNHLRRRGLLYFLLESNTVASQKPKGHVKVGTIFYYMDFLRHYCCEPESPGPAQEESLGIPTDRYSTRTTKTDG